MESIGIYLAKIEDMLSRMEDVIESARAVPFSGKVSIDKNALYDIIDDLRPILDDISKDLPNEILQAKRVISDGDKIINEARNKAASLIKNAEKEVTKILDNHEISKIATAQATQLLEDSKKSAREMRVNAIEYADEILANSEHILRQALNEFGRHAREVELNFTDTIDTIYENRQELRGNSKN